MEPLVTTTRSRSVLIDVPPEQVYEFVTTPGNWPRCHPGSKGITGPKDEHAPVGTSFIEHAQLADDLPKLDLEWIVTEDAPSRWVVTLGESPWGMESIDIIYEFEPHEGGTRFTRSTKFVGTPEARGETNSDLTARVDEADDIYLDVVRDTLTAGS
jgi:hypothetical protein